MDVYTDLLKNNRNYRFLWSGAVVSQFGDWFNLIASASLISELTSTGTALSYLFLARFLPFFLFSPVAGVLADRYDRRTILIASDLLRAATVLGFLLVRDASQIWLLYTLTALQFALSSLFTPARTAVLANVVIPQELITANALDSLTWSTMLALGALSGGVVAAVFGIPTAFILDALTYALSAWFISRIAMPERAVKAPTYRNQGWTDFLDGLRYLKGVRLILVISLVKGAGSLVWGAINVLEVTYAERIFPLGGNGTATLGIIYAVSGLGTGVGPLLLRRWLGDAPHRLRWGIALGFGLLSAGILALSIAPSLATMVVATLVRTLGSGTVWVFSAALLQTIVPDRFRGRVFSFEFAFLTLTQSLSIYWAGFSQDYLGLGLSQVTAVMGGLGLIVGLLWLLFQLRYSGRLERAGATS